MAFGQQSGPPASHKQIELLASLLQAAGHDFRTARHQFGLTQRQAGGKFTSGEASELIDRLTAMADESADPTPEVAPVSRAIPKRAVPQRTAPQRRTAEDTKRALLKDMPVQLLADELQSRGWIAMPPP